MQFCNYVTKIFWNVKLQQWWPKFWKSYRPIKKFKQLKWMHPVWSVSNHIKSVDLDIERRKCTNAYKCLWKILLLVDYSWIEMQFRAEGGLQQNLHSVYSLQKGDIVVAIYMIKDFWEWWTLDFYFFLVSI